MFQATYRLLQVYAERGQYLSNITGILSLTVDVHIHGYSGRGLRTGCEKPFSTDQPFKAYPPTRLDKLMHVLRCCFVENGINVTVCRKPITQVMGNDRIAVE